LGKRVKALKKKKLQVEYARRENEGH
jgi:hypothetical protein